MSDVESAQESAGEPKVIKRYTNRKLYDTVESRYVTLEEIAEMVKSGTEVKIVDNRTKEDLTSVTLAQIIFEEEKKTSKMPLAMLRDIIRTRGNSVQQFFKSEITGRVQAFREEAEKLSDRLFKREGEEGSEGQQAPGTSTAAPTHTPPLAHEEPTKEKDKEKDKESKSKPGTKEMLAQTSKVVEGWQRTLDERIKAVVESMTSLPALAKDLQALEKQITELEAKLKDLEKNQKNEK
jgi:polyhydroxyalkanoate synthesis repressor PhaR